MIDSDTLKRVTARASEIDLTEAGMVHMRREWPGIHFTLCSEDDVPARLKPVAQGPGFCIYLVSCAPGSENATEPPPAGAKSFLGRPGERLERNAEHCVSFTDHLEAATGLVLATDSGDH